jgi:Zn-dependent peptidase ImmA (M78 family)
MSQFDVDDGALSHISTEFNVDIALVKRIHNFFVSSINGMKDQYLAHIIRIMEIYIRQKTGSRFFQINCQPLDIQSKQLNVGCAQYLPKQSFTIFFHPRMDEKQLRVCLAHELGHLFLLEYANAQKENGEPLLTDKTLTEPLSSIFGAFTILDKNKHYETCREKYNHPSREAVISDCILLSGKAGD